MNLIKFEIAFPIIQIKKAELLKQKSNILQLDKSFDKKDQEAEDIANEKIDSHEWESYLIPELVTNREIIYHD